MATDVSICAVTFRRPRGLARLIDSLARQKLPAGLVVEVVLVDNDPEGSAFRAPDRATHAGSLPIRWRHEPAGDIARARNRCVEAARGRWIAFVDDDESAHEIWIAAYAWLAERVEADGFFGPVLPRLEVERDSWLDLETFYADPRHRTGTTLGIAGAYTANAFLRRALLREVPFDPAFGRTLGEDTDCFLRALERGAHFVWCDEACVDEFIPAERHTPGYLTHRAFEGASAWEHIRGSRRRAPGARRGLEALARILAAAVWLPIACLAGRTRGFKAWLRLCVQLGRLWGVLGGHVERPGWRDVQAGRAHPAGR